MKTQNLFLKKATLLLFSAFLLMLIQCNYTPTEKCCPPLSIEKPSFEGCWMTTYSHPNSADTTIKGDIIEKEIPVEITINADSFTINGYWWGALNESAEKGTITGNLVGLYKNQIVGLNFHGTDIAAGSDIDFKLFESGLTFEGTFGALPMWKPITRRFFWKGTKISNCKCPPSIFSKTKK